MSRLLKHKKSESDIADLTPMMDCIFLLLLFFIVASSFSEDTTLVDVELPTAQHATLQSKDDVIALAIDATGHFHLGNTFIPDEQLYPQLNQRLTHDPKQTLVIHGDRQCPYEKIVFATDIAHALHLSQIAFTVQQQ